MTSLQELRHALTGILALVEGSDRRTPSVLAPNMQTWVASPEQGLTAAIESATGREATSDVLHGLAPSSLAVVATVASDGACWTEVTRHSNGEPETCIAGLCLDAGGLISRLVWLRAPLVPGSGPDCNARAPDAKAILERYFADLMSSRFAEAAAHFSVDTLYSHPPYAGGSGRVLFRGREGLRRGLATERGPSPARQVITAFRQRGSRVFVEGVVEGIPDGGTFFSTAQISSRGEIARYVAFYSGTRIPGFPG